MDEDIKNLEQKITKLISMYNTLYEANAQLREDLSQAQTKADDLKLNMDKASSKLEGVLASIPKSEEVA